MIVFTDEDHRQIPQSSHVECLKNLSLVCCTISIPATKGSILSCRQVVAHVPQPLTLKMQASMAGRRADVTRAEQHNPAVIHLLSALFDYQTHEGSWYSCSHMLKLSTLKTVQRQERYGIKLTMCTLRCHPSCNGGQSLIQLPKGPELPQFHILHRSYAPCCRSACCHPVPL